MSTKLFAKFDLIMLKLRNQFQSLSDARMLTNTQLHTRQIIVRRVACSGITDMSRENRGKIHTGSTVKPPVASLLKQ